MTEKSDVEYGVAADLYDHVFVYRNRSDFYFFVELAQANGGPVLEIGCGTGRILLPIAQAGVPITGLDRSPAMLAVCRQRLALEPAEVQARVQIVAGDMRDFSLPARFPLVTLPFRPFQHLLSVEDQLACLDRIRHHLTDDGQLVLDLFNPSLPALTADNLGQTGLAEPAFVTPDGRRVVRRARMIARDYFKQTIQSELLYDITYPDGRQEQLVQPLVMRYFFRYEMEHLLARTGFRVEQVYADYGKNPYGSTYPGELIFMARKA